MLNVFFVLKTIRSITEYKPGHKMLKDNIKNRLLSSSRGGVPWAQPDLWPLPVDDEGGAGG